MATVVLVAHTTGPRVVRDPLLGGTDDVLAVGASVWRADACTGWTEERRVLLGRDAGRAGLSWRELWELRRYDATAGAWWMRHAALLERIGGAHDARTLAAEVVRLIREVDAVYGARIVCTPHTLVALSVLLCAWGHPPLSAWPCTHLITVPRDAPADEAAADAGAALGAATPKKAAGAARRGAESSQ